jgi:hypothetical protein
MDSPVIRRTFTPTLFASVISLSTVCLLAPSMASALDFRVQPRINSGVMYYEFEQDPTFSLGRFPNGNARRFGPISERSINDIMPFVGGGTTLLVNRFYLDLYVQKAFSGDDQYTQAFLNPNNPLLAFEQQVDNDWDREEYSLSLGYALTDSFSVYAGYRRSDTEFDEEAVVTTFNRFGVPTTFPQPIPRTLDYEQDGPFVGSSYGWRIGEAGTLAFNLAIAFVDGDVQQDTGPGTVLGFSGNTVGTTLGLSWSAPLPVLESFKYNIGIDGYQYNFEGEDTEQLDVADFQETIVRGSAGVSYLF